MYRFHCLFQDIFDDKIAITDKSRIHHIKDILRLSKKEEVTLFDERGNEYVAGVEKISKEIISFRIKNRRAFNTLKKIKITLACAIPKKSKMDDIIDRLTQLGVDRIIPLKTERVVIKLDKQKEILRQRRWERIALSATQQSQRNTLPLIDSIKDIKQVLYESDDFDLKLIPTLSGQRKSLKEIFTESNPKNILVLIGPEGDFTDEEVALAKKSGCIPVSLGDLVLRVDTAAVAIVSYIKLSFT